MVGWRNVVCQTMESHGRFSEIASTCTTPIRLTFRALSGIPTVTTNVMEGKATLSCSKVYYL